MASKIIIKHKDSGISKTGYYGFSWTYLFFGWFVPLFRGELGTGALHLLFTIFTLGIWQFIVCFLYNRQYMERVLASGYEFNDSEHAVAAAKVKLNIS